MERLPYRIGQRIGKREATAQQALNQQFWRNAKILGEESVRGLEDLLHLEALICVEQCYQLIGCAPCLPPLE